MQLVHLSIAKLLFLAGVGMVIAANSVAFVILGEVNARRQPEQQHSILSFNWRFFQIWSEHERLFPKSRRRLHCILCFLAGLVCCLSAACFAIFSG